MAPQLYAFKEDLDMVIQDVQNLKKGYGSLNYFAKIAHDLELEQKCQAGQMKRMEKELRSIRQKFEELAERIDRMETRLDRIEKLLLLICQKLEINP